MLYITIKAKKTKKFTAFLSNKTKQEKLKYYRNSKNKNLEKQDLLTFNNNKSIINRFGNAKQILTAKNC